MVKRNEFPFAPPGEKVFPIVRGKTGNYRFNPACDRMSDSGELLENGEYIESGCRPVNMTVRRTGHLLCDLKSEHKSLRRQTLQLQNIRCDHLNFIKIPAGCMVMRGKWIDGTINGHFNVSHLVINGEGENVMGKNG